MVQPIATPQSRIPMKIKQGTSFYVPITYLQSDGITPVDLTGYTMLMKIRPTYTSADVLANLTDGNGGLLFLDRAAGQIAINILPAATADFVYPSKATGDLYLTEPDGSVGPYLAFIFDLVPTVNY